MSSYFEQRMAEISAHHAATASEREARLSAQLLEDKRRERAFLKKQKEQERGHVYFFRAGNTVKIGFSTNLRERAKSLQTACQERACMVKIVKGGPKVEKAFHARFAEYRLRGEWFDLRGTLAKYLERCFRPIDLPAPEPEPEFVDDFRL